MKATVSEPTSWKRVIDIEVPSAEIEQAIAGKLSTYRKEVKLPGFRPGKVPESVIQARFGEAIHAEIVEDMIQKAYETACKENSLTPICRAKVNNVKADTGKPLTASIETEVDPKIEIKGYDKLKIKIDTKKIKPADVDEALEGLRGRVAEFKDVERSAKKGDFATIEYVKLSIEGEERKDFSNPKYPVEIGNSKLKEFDKELAGTKAGDTVDVSLKFPKDYTEGELAGKKAEFTVKVTKVQEKIMPELNEEFLKKMGDFPDIDALKQQILKDLESREAERSRSEAYNKAIDTLIKDNPFEVPPSRIESYIDYMLEEAQRYAQQGQAIPAREEVASRYSESGARLIKRQRIIDAIAEKENIKATGEEVDAEIRKLATTYNQPFEQLKDALRKDNTALRIRMDIREQKTLNYLIGERGIPLPAQA